MAMERKEYLYRLLLGLEEGIERTQGELKYYKPEDIELKYAKKFLTSMEESLKATRAELDAIEAADKESKKAAPPAP